MPNANLRPWRMFIPLAIVLVLALFWTVYWFVASGIAQDRFSNERARLAKQGLTLSCEQEDWSGYPFHFEFACGSPVVRSSNGGELRSTRLLLVALAYAPWQVAALIDGPTTLSAQRLSSLEVKHQRALASVTFDKAWRPSLSAELPVVEIAGMAKAKSLMLFTRPGSSAGTDIALEAAGMGLTLPDRPPLNIERGSLQGTLDANNVLAVERFELTQGTLRFWGSGEVALDEQHRIAGQINTETNDAQALLATAGPQLGLSDSKLANLRTMLGLLGNEAKAPIIAKDGVLYLGPFQIGTLDALY